MGGSGSRPKYHKGSDPDLSGKVAIVTGASAGIGKETVRALVRKGATVVMATRNEAKTKTIMEDLKKDCRDGEEQLVWMKLVLNDIDQVNGFVQEYKASGRPLHYLINNAGVMNCPFSTTAQGFDVQVGTNHFGHFVLTLGLVDLLKENAPSRVVTVSSMGHQFSTNGVIPWEQVAIPNEKEYNGFWGRMRWYGHSKYANILFTKALSTRLEGSGVAAFSTHPGGVNTELGRSTTGYYALAPLMWLLARTPQTASETSLYCALAPDVEQFSGQYFTYESQNKGIPASVSHDNFNTAEAADLLWDKSLELCKCKDPFRE